LLEKIAGVTARYLKFQIEAGAAAVQLFDTWAGELTPDEYNEFEQAATAAVFESLGENGVPKILFAKGSSRHLENLARTGANVLSVDWRTDLGEARKRLGTSVALQGNVDPSVLLGDEADVRRAAREAIEKTGGVGHILNLGHGILPTTPVANARAFVEAGQTAMVSAH
jgi:uroporphyrinogen decarboxylase